MSPCITSDIFFQPEFRDAFDSAPDSSEDTLKADIERLMSQAKYEAVVIAERNLARSDISPVINDVCGSLSFFLTHFPLYGH